MKVSYVYRKIRKEVYMQFTFGKKESQLIKGIAIIAMFYHHFLDLHSGLHRNVISFIHMLMEGV